MLLGYFALIAVTVIGGCDADQDASAPTVPRAAEVWIPSSGDWQERGTALAPGAPGSWDVVLDGMINPGAVIKKDGVFFLYYIGADGRRASDGGPRHRAIGVATSTDGIHFKKYSRNPVVTVSSGRDLNPEEEGAFSIAAEVNPSGDVALFYGAMLASGSTTVFSDIFLANSQDGLDFTVEGSIVQHSDESVYNHGDELFPIATFQHAGSWNVYYIAKGNVGSWTLGLARGPEPSRLLEFDEVWDPRPEQIRDGGTVIRLDDDRALIPVVLASRGGEWRIEMMETRRDDPQRFMNTLATYRSIVPDHATVFRDSDTGQWYLYYLDEIKRIGVKTAQPRP